MTAQRPWRRLDVELDGVSLLHEMLPGDAPILMVHGIGPGTTGRLNFAPLFDRLSSAFALHVIDLAGFGASQRIASPPFFDVDFWVRQITLAIDRIEDMHGCAPMLVGNSVGGALVLKASASRPLVRRVLSIAAPAAAAAPAALRAFWRAPLDTQSLASALGPMTGVAMPPDPALVQARFEPFRSASYHDYFDAMLADPEACLSAAVLRPDEAAAIRARVCLLHGRMDRACPVEATLARLVPILPDADVCLLGDCGHNVISERTAEVIAAIERLAGKVDLP